MHRNLQPICMRLLLPQDWSPVPELLSPPSRMYNRHLIHRKTKCTQLVTQLSQTRIGISDTSNDKGGGMSNGNVDVSFSASRKLGDD